VASTKTTFDDLSVPEQILHVQELWDRIAANPERVPVSDTQRAALRRRLEEYRAAPDRAVPWSEARSRIRKKR
jgi:putative addiction module component (TIGR02574 family)